MCNCTNGCSSCSVPITIPTGPAGAPGAAGTNGTNGTNGIDGLFGGFSAEWAFDTSTSTGPGSTLLRLNNAAYASVTEIYVSEDNIGGINVDNFITSFNNSGAFGLVRLFKEDDSTIFWYGRITGVTDNGTDQTLTVTYIGHNGSFSATDNVVLSFAANGQDAAGTSGVVVLHNDLSQPSTTSATFVTSATKTIVANTLPSDGDRLHIRVIASGIDDSTDGIRVLMNGAFFTTVITEFELEIGKTRIFIDMWLERKSNTVGVASSESKTASQLAGATGAHKAIVENPATALGAFNFTTTPFDIDVQLKANGVATLAIEQFLVELHKI